ncbi:diguanylate cyclase [Bacillus marasmi]|uniref:diguanylate cyclase n=1 Tax=Bacillus marasmi TaxID=1926279 RepID=UPI0011C90DE1|nr:diguanylate cyclase [Bacillus marasmi]
MIIKELLANLGIMTSLIFIYTQVNNATPLNKSSDLKRKILLGVFGGLLSNVLMQYSMSIGDTIIDLRHIPIILLSFFGGAIPAFIATILIIIGRFFIGYNISSFVAVPLIVSITISTSLISNTKVTKNLRRFLMLVVSNILYSIAFCYLIKDVNTLFILIPSYWIISFLAGYIAFYILEYIRNSQDLFHRYKSESTTDGLTGLNNFRRFNDTFNSIISKMESKNEKLSLLYIDIDFFKKINDTYGHKEGDIVLKDLGMILMNAARSYDIVSRNGGEEFSIILLDCPLKRAMEISENIRETVEKYPFTLSSGEIIYITISIGVASFDETTPDIESLLEDADKALYQAKRTGRNKVCVFNLTTSQELTSVAD